MVWSKEAIKSPALEAQKPRRANGSQVEHPTTMALWLQPPGAEVGARINCDATSSSDLFYCMCAKESWRFKKRSLPTSG